MNRDDRLFLTALTVTLVLIVLILATAGPQGAAGGTSFPGEPRNVETDLLLRRLQNGELSDREALYYRKLERER